MKGKAPEVTVAAERKEPTKVINIMAALKESMDKRRAKVGSAVKRRMGKEDKPTVRAAKEPSASNSRGTAH